MESTQRTGLHIHASSQVGLYKINMSFTFVFTLLIQKKVRAYIVT